VYLINVYIYIKYVAQIEKKEKWMNGLYLKFSKQTRLLDRLICQTRLLKRSGQTLIKPLTGKMSRLRP
jgi:hypothetical protein